MAEVTSKDFSINMQYVAQRSDSSLSRSTKFDRNDPKDTESMFDQRRSPARPVTSNLDEAPSSGNEKSTPPQPEVRAYPNEGGEERGHNWGMIVFFVLESTIFACVMGILISNLTVDKMQNVMFWDLGIWKWCLLALAILCGRLFTYLLTEAMLFLIWIFWLDEKVLYFAYGVKKSVMFFIWLSLITLAWGLLSTLGVKRSKDTNKILHDVTKGLGGCLIGAALWLLKTLFIKLVGSLHATKLFEKIMEAIRLRKVLLALSVADIDDIDSGKQKVNKIASFRERVHKLTLKMGRKKNKERVEAISTQTMIELVNAIRGKKLIPLTYVTTGKKKDENIKNKDRRNSNGSQNNIAGKIAAALTAAQEITDEASAKSAANDIFSTLAGSEKAEYLNLEKLLQIVKDEKVTEQFHGLAEDKQRKTEIEKSNTEDNHIAGRGMIETEQKQCKAEDKESNTEGKYVKKSVFRNWVVDTYRDHDSLNNTLKHSKTAIDELNVIASVIVLIIISVTWLLFMEFLSTKLLLFLSSQLLLVVFMFGNTVKTVFEAVIFVFVVHPFDVGDRCVIQGVQMVVDEMNILTTTFLRYDGEKIYYPNAVLASKPISNFYRSPPMMDTVEFAINLKTPTEDIKQLQDEIKTYLENNPRRWRHDHSVLFKEIEDMNKMKVALYVNHTINFHNIGKRGKRRSELILEMKRIFEELKIEYHLLPQQVKLLSDVDSKAASQV